MASDDPDFETKAADVIGLYLNPPQHAAVFCVDEKSAIQALDPVESSIAVVARSRGEAWVRILSPRNSFFVCRPGRENRRGSRQNGGAAYQ